MILREMLYVLEWNWGSPLHGCDKGAMIQWCMCKCTFLVTLVLKTTKFFQKLDHFRLRKKINKNSILGPIFSNVYAIILWKLKRYCVRGSHVDINNNVNTADNIWIYVYNSGVRISVLGCAYSTDKKKSRSTMPI